LTGFSGKKPGNGNPIKKIDDSQKPRYKDYIE